MERTDCAIGLNRLCGIRFPGKGWPVWGSIRVTPTPEKSPCRQASGATERTSSPGRSRTKPWKSPKKNSLFLISGPPSVAPKMCWDKSAFFAAGTTRLLSQLLAAMLLSRQYSKAEPRNSFVPDLIVLPMTAPATLPYSAETLLVSTRTSARASVLG